MCAQCAASIYIYRIEYVHTYAGVDIWALQILFFIVHSFRMGKCLESFHRSRHVRSGRGASPAAGGGVVLWFVNKAHMCRRGVRVLFVYIYLVKKSIDTEEGLGLALDLLPS
jgi:hypothetical protein